MPAIKALGGISLVFHQGGGKTNNDGSERRGSLSSSSVASPEDRTVFILAPGPWPHHPQALLEDPDYLAPEGVMGNDHEPHSRSLGFTHALVPQVTII